ncbi:hypothetical protein [Glycomyces buryatensis]|uniref:hypothetical protein n=1 Tax=Glycomyces buryatensis TaxID=2570927 RepID=UPI001FE6976D|nr:hypothetical protein [Glycomyces buryatensis]
MLHDGAGVGGGEFGQVHQRDELHGAGALAGREHQQQPRQGPGDHADLRDRGAPGRSRLAPGADAGGGEGPDEAEGQGQQGDGDDDGRRFEGVDGQWGRREGCGVHGRVSRT